MLIPMTSSSSSMDVDVDSKKTFSLFCPSSMTTMMNSQECDTEKDSSLFERTSWIVMVYCIFPIRRRTQPSQEDVTPLVMNDWLNDWLRKMFLTRRNSLPLQGILLSSLLLQCRQRSPQPKSDPKETISRCYCCGISSFGIPTTSYCVPHYHPLAHHVKDALRDLRTDCRCHCCVTPQRTQDNRKM